MLHSRLTNIVYSTFFALLLVTLYPQPVFVEDPVTDAVHSCPTNCVVEVSRHSFHQSTPSYPEPVVFDVTAYTLLDPGMPAHGLTASGTRPRPWRTVAADTRILPLGTKIYIPTLANTPSKGWFIVEDTGGVICGYKLDLYFESRIEALRFGRRNLKVYVYK